ncbi:MAG: SDR family NAD(P)-dependent oxidoreductase [Pseudomonadota bacterium]
MGNTESGFGNRYGPWALVTGASDGIGRAAAELLAARGMNLVLVARREKRLRELADRLSHVFDVECRTLPIDLAEPGATGRLIAELEGLDIGLLVAAAGFGTSGPFSEGALLSEKQMLAVNCGAVLELTHRLSQGFVARGSGGIVLLSSVVAFQGVAGSAHYAATKAWVQTLGEGLHAELSNQGVDVICAAPGPVDTGFATRANMVMTNAASPHVVARETLAALGRKRTVRPGRLAKLLGLALTVPRWARILIMKQVMAGMTKHQRPPATTEQQS